MNCVAASLLAPAHTHWLQLGQDYGCAMLSIHSCNFFDVNNAVSGSKWAMHLHPPLGWKTFLLLCAWHTILLPLPQSLLHGRAPCGTEPVTCLRSLGLWCQTPATHQDLRRGEHDLASQALCKWASQPQPGCNNSATCTACPPCLCFCLLILHGSNTSANVKQHQETSNGDHTINPVMCILVTSLG